MGIAAVTAPQYLDKVAPGWLQLGSGFGILAVGLFAISIFFGGVGQTRAPGYNAFNRQALSGLGGIAALMIAAVIFTCFPKKDESDTRLHEVQGQLKVMEGRLNVLEQLLLSQATAPLDRTTGNGGAAAPESPPH